MKKLLYLYYLFFIGCTHNSSPKSYKIVSKTGNFVSLNNTTDTLLIGDTLAVSFDLTNKIKLDDSSVLNIKSIINSGFGYQFNKNGVYPMFDFAPKVVELKESYLQDEGRFFFKPLLKNIIGSTIHYVPQDTGTYVLTTERNQYIVCNVLENSDQYQINLFPDFNVPSIHSTLLDIYPIAKTAFESGKTNDASPYYCFYVKPK
jgi:hypothetical protein